MYVEFLQTFNFSYRIDVQPQGNVSRDALVQGMRCILFNLNKKYLIVRKFGHLPPDQKFWGVLVEEGDNVSKGVHFHILLHSPVERIDWLNDILLPWSRLKLSKFNRSRRSGKFLKRYPVWVQAKGWGHNPCDELDYVPLLRVERCQNVTGSLIYNQKNWQSSDPENFIVGLCET